MIYFVQDVWTFLRGLSIPYPSLYDQVISTLNSCDAILLIDFLLFLYISYGFFRDKIKQNKYFKSDLKYIYNY